MTPYIHKTGRNRKTSQNGTGLDENILMVLGTRRRNISDRRIDGTAYLIHLPGRDWAGQIKVGLIGIDDFVPPSARNHLGSCGGDVARRRPDLLDVMQQLNPAWFNPHPGPASFLWRQLMLPRTNKCLRKTLPGDMHAWKTRYPGLNDRRKKLFSETVEIQLVWCLLTAAGGGSCKCSRRSGAVQPHNHPGSLALAFPFSSKCFKHRGAVLKF